MKKPRIIFIFIVFLVLLINVNAGNFFQKNSFYEKKFVNSDPVLQNIQKHGEAKVFVNISKEDYEKDPILSKKKIEFVDNLAVVDLNQKEYEILKKSSDVTSITDVRKFYLVSQESNAIINANISWNLQISGLNLTGAGQSICIIDTGINYSHADLGGCFGNNNASSTCKVIGGWNVLQGNTNITDYHGHGTHVSGIAAANGSIVGVAPGANIIFIKAYNDTDAGFYENDLINAINWCVSNASLFNISVISMSLGANCSADPSACSTGYCNSDPLTSYINSAVARNISVVIASGNDNKFNVVSSPACIQNATAVTSSNSSDNGISTFANTWNDSSLILLAAPGESINSTWKTGAYSVLSGTSMSTPHVAGAIAILNQFLNLSNRQLNSTQIKNEFNSTGKQIYDFSANRFFGRINVYSALLDLDTISPSVNLSFPANSTVNKTQNQTFSCNSTDWQLSNVTFYLWNSTSLVNSSSLNVTGTQNQTNFSVNNIPFASYTWNCYFTDAKSNLGEALNYSLNIQNITSNLISPTNNYYTNSSSNNFSCSFVSDSRYALTNSTFYLWNSTSLLNYSTQNISGITNQTNFTYNFSSEVNYTWNCESFNNNSDSDLNDINYTFIYDKTPPNITSVSSSTTASSATITWNTDEVANSTITISGQNQNSTSYNLSHSLTFSSLSSSTTYSFNITSCDQANNCNTTNGSFTTSTTQTSSSSRGGGGGGAPSDYKINETQLENSFSKNLLVEGKVKFSINNQNHSLTLKKIYNNSIDITIQSEPINLSLKIGEEKKINISSSNYYDLYIKLESLQKSWANITIKSINETIIKNNNQSNENRKFIPLITNSSNKQNNKFYYIAIVLFIIILFVLHKIRNFRKGKRK